MPMEISRLKAYRYQILQKARYGMEGCRFENFVHCWTHEKHLYILVTREGGVVSWLYYQVKLTDTDTRHYNRWRERWVVDAEIFPPPNGSKMFWNKALTRLCPWGKSVPMVGGPGILHTEWYREQA